MKKHKWLIGVILIILSGLIIYFTGLFQLNNNKSYGELGISKSGFYSTNKDLLSKKLKKIYKKIDKSVYSLEPEIQFDNVKKNEIKKVIEYYKADNPQIFWLKNDFSLEQQIFTNDITGANLEYYYIDLQEKEQVMFTPSLVNKMNRELELESKKIIDSIPKEYTNYQKAKYVHDYLVSTIKYDKSGNFSHNVYGALVDKKAVCDGLSKAYMYLLSQLGIESRIVYGKSEEGIAHSWNIIKLDDEYYHVDLTWDMPQKNSDTIIYSNFCITDDDVKKKRKIYSPYNDINDSIYAPIPRCDSTKYNYYKKEGLLISSYSDFNLDYILDLLNKTAGNKEKSIQIKFAKQKDFKAFIEDLKAGDNKKFYRFPYSNSERKVSIKTINEDNIVIFEFEYK